MTEANRFPRLDDAEQEVLLCAVEGTDLFHIVWSFREDGSSETDEQLRPKAEAVIRKLIELGWVRLAEAWQDKLPPGQHKTVTVAGRRMELASVYREERISADRFDEVLRDPNSWALNRPYEVVLVTTDEGDEAVKAGVLDEAYAKFLGKRDSRA